MRNAPLSHRYIETVHFVPQTGDKSQSSQEIASPNVGGIAYSPIKAFRRHFPKK